MYLLWMSFFFFLQIPNISFRLFTDMDWKMFLPVNVIALINYRKLNFRLRVSRRTRATGEWEPQTYFSVTSVGKQQKHVGLPKNNFGLIAHEPKVSDIFLFTFRVVVIGHQIHQELLLARQGKFTVEYRKQVILITS
jgi:hypothetical protein